MVKAEILRAKDAESTVTVPQKLAPQSQSSLLTPHPVRTSASPFPIIQRPQSSPPHAISEHDGSPGPISDLMAHLHRSAPSVVKTRSGSVLSRGFILKTDHYPSGKPPNHLFAPFYGPAYHIGRALDLDLNVHGAPNFRAPRVGSLNVFGAAQPRSQGLRAILSILRARSTDNSPSHVIWISTREEPIGNTVVYSFLAPLKFPFVSLGNQSTYQGALLSLGIHPSQEILYIYQIGQKTLRQSNSDSRTTFSQKGLGAVVKCAPICAIWCPLLCRFGGLVLTHNEIGKELAVCVSCDLFNRCLSNRGWRRRHSAYLDRRRLKQCQDFPRTLGIHEKPRLECGGEHLFMSFLNAQNKAYQYHRCV